MTVTRLSDTTQDEVRKLLVYCGVKIYATNTTYLNIICPSCNEKRAYIYCSVGKKVIICNRSNECSYKVELWDLIAQKLGLDITNNREILKRVNEILGYGWMDR